MKTVNKLKRLLKKGAKIVQVKVYTMDSKLTVVIKKDKICNFNRCERIRKSLRIRN